MERKTWSPFAGLLLCCICVAWGSAPLFAQALPPSSHRPERTRQGQWSSRPPRSAETASAVRRVGPSAPLPPRQDQEGPEVFSVHVGPHPLLERYLALYTSAPWRGWLERVLRRAQPFLGYIQERIAYYRLPPELRFLPIAESSYDPYAVSKAGAAGLWQLMPKTGSAYGLSINSWVDGRFDFRGATDASLETLRYDHQVLGNWLLALAAYDAGLNFMRYLVEKTGIQDYWTLAADGYLPHETVDYVPRFLAIAAICSYPGRYGLPLSWSKPLEWTRIKVREPVNLRLLAEQARISGTLLAEGNAGLRYGVTPPEGSRYYIEVPKNDAPNIDRALTAGKDSLMFFYVYAVRKGDTLAGLAHHYGVPVSMVLSYNPLLRRQGLQAGTWLLIPAVKKVAPYRLPPPPLPKAARRVRARLETQFSASYVVRRGDTLWSIAAHFHTTPALVAEANGLEEDGIIHPGLRLHVPPAG